MGFGNIFKFVQGTTTYNKHEGHSWYFRYLNFVLKITKSRGLVTWDPRNNKHHEKSTKVGLKKVLQLHKVGDIKVQMMTELKIKLNSFNQAVNGDVDNIDSTQATFSQAILFKLVTALLHLIQKPY